MSRQSSDKIKSAFSIASSFISDATGKFISMADSTLRDEIAEVTYLDENLRVNLVYEYSGDDINEIWAVRSREISRFCDEHKIPGEKRHELIIPDYEIRLNNVPGEIGDLTHYLKENVLKNQQDKSRIIFVPMNTGGHWIALLIYVDKYNRIASAICINSMKHPGHKKETGYTLLKTSKITQAICAAYPSFKYDVKGRYFNIQQDVRACGPLVIENAIETIKMIYSGAPSVPVECTKEKIAQIRAMHIKLLGCDHSFYEMQLNNQSKALNGADTASMVEKMSAEPKLTEDGKKLVNNIRKLPPGCRAVLRNALLPVTTSSRQEHEHLAHLKRLRTAIIAIKEDLKSQELPNEEQNPLDILDNILKVISDGEVTYETIKDIEDISWDLPIKLKGGFDQLILVGKSIDENRSSLFHSLYQSPTNSNQGQAPKSPFSQMNWFKDFGFK